MSADAGLGKSDRNIFKNLMHLEYFLRDDCVRRIAQIDDQIHQITQFGSARLQKFFYICNDPFGLPREFICMDYISIRADATGG